jgi:hypothetical protein
MAEEGALMLDTPLHAHSKQADRDGKVGPGPDRAVAQESSLAQVLGIPAPARPS